MYWPAEPLAAMCAVTKPSILPPSQLSCSGPQLWLVDGICSALVVVVSAWKGSR